MKYRTWKGLAPVQEEVILQNYHEDSSGKEPRLVPFPVLAGTWCGVINSTWIDPKSGQKSASIPFVLVVRQTFLTIHCSMFTEESKSKSYSASIIID